jgi:glycosyltransferase involved in cell wall biosynthesis
MRIAYVTIHVAPEIMRGGVGKKIQTQTALWRELGHEATLFCLTPAEIPISQARQFIFDSGKGLIKREIARSAALTKMLAAIRAYQPDVIYLRFGLYSYPLHRLFKIAPVVLETNSDDMQEYAKRGKFFYWMNRLTRNLTFGPAHGIVIPTFELEPVILPKRNKPARVISNGINLKDIEPLPPTKHTTPVIALVGSPHMTWHGVDKLFRLAEMCPDIAIHIVGYAQSDIEIPAPPNLRLHGFLNKDGVRKVLADADVACGSLAVHRNNMQEASVLKIREALAYGIPVIIAYRDTDLDEVSADFILRIPNTEDNVAENAKAIRDFAYAMIGKRADIDSIASRLDQRQKEKTRLEYFQQVIDLVH